MSDDTTTPLEARAPDEAERIANTVALTKAQMMQRYVDGEARRGVHPKDHGCVRATFTVSETLDPSLRVGVFAEPGRRFDAFIRFSNADVDPGKDDSPMNDGQRTHGSRGMAIKLLGVEGDPLDPANLTMRTGPLNQDFLMINQPVFAFANIVDYEALSEILLEDKDEIRRFFGRITSPDPDVKFRAERTLGIISRVTALTAPPAFQEAPTSPFDNRYFSASAFLFGPGRAMKISAIPVAPSAEFDADIDDPDYLRAGLARRLREADATPIEFDFAVQVREAAEIGGNVATEIEDVCVEWPELAHPFTTVARISIAPAQAPDDPVRMALCENLFFSPWNGLAAHRPLGGINRLRRDVYAASAQTRQSRPGCPVGHLQE